MIWGIAISIIITDLLTSVTCNECTEKDTVGSLSYGNTIADDKTYILAGYEIPSNRIIIGWEFCYRTSDVASVTFYPGIWRITDRTERNGDTDYELIQSNNITYSPRNATNLFSCLKIDLSVKDRINVSTPSFIGLYSNTRSLLLHTYPDDSLTTYEYDGNKSRVMNARPNNNLNFNISIRAYIEADGTSDEIVVGSLNYDTSIVDDGYTFILATNAIPCVGIVAAWEFCYQASNIDELVTFYPGIWRITPQTRRDQGRGRGRGDDYELVRLTKVTFNTNARGISCRVFQLFDRDQFVAPKDSFIGLYTNTGIRLLRTNDDNSSITTFQSDGNQSSVPDNRMEDVDYNIAIRVHLRGLNTSAAMSVSSMTSLTITAPFVMTTAATVTVEAMSTSMTSTLVTSTLSIIRASTSIAATATNIKSLVLTKSSYTSTRSITSTTSVSTITVYISPDSTSNAYIASGDEASSSVAGVVAGCVVGVTVCVAIVALTIFLFYCQRRRKDKIIQDVPNYVNCKSKDAKDDYQFSDHQYSVVRHKVPYESEMNGMITIKEGTAGDYEAVNNSCCYYDVNKANGDLIEKPNETTPYMEPTSIDHPETGDSSDYYSVVYNDSSKLNEATCYMDPVSTIAKDHSKPLRNDYETVPVLSIHETPDYWTPLAYQYEIDTGSVFRNSMEDSTEDETLPDDEQIYEDPGYSKEGIYSWFEEKKFRKIKRSDIKISQKLGSGEFGVVNLGLWSKGSTDPVQVAVKTLNSQCSESDRVKFLREAAIMGQFVHNNVVQLHGVVTEEENMMIILEYMPKGDLREFLNKLKPLTPLEEGSELKHDLLSYCRQIAAGMNYLASKHFVHRDLAARNVLVSSDDVCKIADFGMARDVADDTYYVTSGGKIPVKWTAPEAIFYKKYSAKSDIWSFGCVMYEIWSLGHKPFEGFNGKECAMKIITGYRLPPPPGCPRAIYELMIQCWHPTARSRPTSGSILETLQKSDRDLLASSVLETDDDTDTSDSQSMLLGASITAGEQLYLHLQNRYIPSKTK